MPQDPFPLPPGDAEEPDGSPLPAGDGTGPEDAGEDAGEGMGQGLYVCLPAEQLTLAGFAQGGEADTMAPGPCSRPWCTPWPAKTARGWADAPMTS